MESPLFHGTLGVITPYQLTRGFIDLVDSFAISKDDTILDQMLQFGNSQVSAYLKRHLLFFDKLYLHDIETSLDLVGQKDLDAGLFKAELEWLLEKDLIVSGKISIPKEDDLSTFQTYLRKIGVEESFFSDLEKSRVRYRNIREKLLQESETVLHLIEPDEDKTSEDKELPNQGEFNSDAIGEEINILKRKKEYLEKEIEKIEGALLMFHETQVLKSLDAYDFYFARFVAILLSFRDRVNAIPVTHSFEFFGEAPDTTKSETIQVIINNLPLPSDNTPWEQIIDYRNDSTSRNNLINLRRWARKITSEKLTAIEIQEELDWILNEFEKNMKLHKMKTNTETVEAIINAPLEILEDLIRFKFSKLTKPFFAVKKGKSHYLKRK